MMSTSPLSHDVPAAHGPHVTAWALFLTFSQITLSGFGGMVFWARRVLVERQHWLTEQEFVDLLALGQLLPGPNVLNVTVMVGYRCAGWAGAAAAVTGFLGGPCLLVVALGMLHQRYGTLPLVQPALTGMAAVSAGLLLASVVKMTTVLPRHWRPWLFVGLAFHRRRRRALAAPGRPGRAGAMGHYPGMERQGLMDRADLGALFLHFLLLSFLAIGGTPTVLPDMHRYVVEVHHWMSSAQFATLYALAQVAPGPNVMYIPLIGWQVAGWAGVAATTLPLLVPAGTLTLLVGHLDARHPQAALGRALRRGLTPITLGLMLASGWILLRAVNHDWRGYLLTLLTVGLVLRTPWNPLWLIAAGALVGMAGLV